MSANDMSRRRWRAVDAVLQVALEAEPGQRDAVIVQACAGDDALRAEVASLLAAHVEHHDDFLQPPVPFGELAAFDAPSEGSPTAAAMPRARMVSARAALAAALVTLMLGFVAGALVNRAPLAPQAVANIAMNAMPSTAAGARIALVDRSGRELRGIPATRPWTPRFSPDGRSVAYGAFGAGRESSDLWVADVETGATRRLTDDDRDANDPQWSPDGRAIAYSAGPAGAKEAVVQPVAGGTSRLLSSGGASVFPGDWTRDGRTVLVTKEAGQDGHDIVAQPASGGAARPYAATAADETAPRVSPDGRWVAYTSSVSGRAEVYLDTWPSTGHRVAVSRDGGMHPVWRGDGRELFYWRNGTLVAVAVTPAKGTATPALGAQTELFRAPYPGGVTTMYDVSPDGQRFVIALPR